MRKTFRRFTALVSALAMTAASAPAVSVAADGKFPLVVEGEDMEGAELWTSIYADEFPDYSGKGFTYLTGGEVSFKVTVPEDAMYQIVVRGVQILDAGGRYETVAVNGSEYSKTVPYADKWTDFDFGMVRLKKGENTISFLNKYGYMAIDYVTVSEAVFPDLSGASDTPCDPDATPETKALMKYLKSVYGKNILAGQQEIYGGGHEVQTTIRFDADKKVCVDADGKSYTFSEEDIATADDGSKFVWKCFDEEGNQYNYDSQNRGYKLNDYGFEIRYLKETTGEEPAIRGFDFGSYCPCYAWDDGVAQRMIDWTTKRNGICTASWHVNVPTRKADYTLGEPLDFALTTYTEKTDFVTANCMVKGTMEYDYFQLCMKNLAAELKKLQDAGVPVLFRPFHEAEGNPSHTDDPTDGSGAWFWWSKEGAKVYNELWAFLQDTLRDEYGLHNLIYEQNLYAWSDHSAAWYSGDDRVDIVGFDKYNCTYNRHDGLAPGVPNEDAEAGIFYTLNSFVKGKKMVAMPENDTIPSLTNLKVEHAAWLYFCPWYDSEQEHFLCGEKYQNVDTLKEIYTSDYCITLSELPADLFKGGDAPATSTTKAPAVTTTTTTAAVSDILYGDANTDGKVTIADAAAVLQYLGNKDKYMLSKRGGRCADCDGEVGISTGDAVAIQKYAVELVKELPIKK